MYVIEEKISEIQEGPLLFKAGDMTCEVLPEDLRIVPDTGQIAKQLEDYVDSRSKFVPSFLFRKGPKTVMAGPSNMISTDLNDIAEKIARNLSNEALPERYEFSGYDLVILPAEKGQVVTSQAVLEALEHLEGTTVEVPFQEVAAPNSEALEPLSLVAFHETNYKLDEADRNVNLALAAKAVHGRVLLPGETYSFNKEAGERSVQRGYRYANVVVGNRLVPDVGGGICQITTTLFNAAAESGLEFPEIHAHGIPVDYADPGCDAAVAWNYLDLKVRNAFETPVVLGAWVEDGTVTVRVFGKPNDSTYELDPVVLEEYPEEGMNPGLLVETYRVEKRNGEVVRRQLLVRSYYQPSYPR
jgi:vancomycin resistance protein YoaR